ncbi:hypothetical protein SEVIR_1G076802v4 [Setaria viridis]
MTVTGFEYKRRMGSMHFVGESNVDAPVPLALPVPDCSCGVPVEDGCPLCDFNEYIYEPKLMWPTEEQVREFKAGKAPWLCVSSPSDRCKCGILATQGVVPSELGYGSFYGNAYDEYWEGRTCDWKDFSRHRDLLLKLGHTSEP